MAWQDLSLAGLARANEENLFALFESLRKWPRIQVQADERALRTLSDVPFPIFNSVLRARLGREPELAAASLLAPYRERGLPMMWWLGPGTRPAGLGAILEREGLLRAASSIAMALDLGRTLPPAARIGGFRIERVWGEETLAGWIRAYAAGFGLPDFVARAWAEGLRAVGFGPTFAADHYLGVLDGRPVASASLFRGAGVAGVYNVAVREGARGRGIGTAVTLAALADARAEGFRVAVLQASALGHGVYRSLGFEDLFELEQWVWVGGEAVD